MSNSVGKEFLDESKSRRVDLARGVINHCLDQLGDDDIWWAPAEGCNCIGVIIQHLLGNLRQWIVSGIGGEPDIRDRPKEFMIDEKHPKSVLQRKLNEMLDQVAETYSNFDPARVLDMSSVQGFDASVLSAIYRTMTHLELHAEDQLPVEAEELFEKQLADSRRPLPEDREDRDEWRFALTCAVTPDGHVLGGVHIDIGPIGGAGPLAKEKLAYLERTLIRPEYRRQGLATELLRKAIEVAGENGCRHIRCSNNWDNPAETALLMKCGFALVDINGEEDEEPCYFAVIPLQGLRE